MIDIEHYSSYYSLDKLLEQIISKNLDTNHLQTLSHKELFDIAIDNGLDDLAEYLYIYHGIEFSISKLFNNISFSISQPITDNSMVTIENTVNNDFINIDYMSGKELDRKRIIQRLMALKKYSKIRHENKEFYYKFLPKYIHLIQ